MEIKALNHVALPTADLDASMRFYGEIIGLKPIERPAFSFPGAWFAIGDAGQELHLIGNREPGAVIDQSRGKHFAIHVDRIDDWIATFREHAIEHRQPGRRPDGARQLFVRDPDGHLVELCELPEG